MKKHSNIHLKITVLHPPNGSWLLLLLDKRTFLLIWSLDAPPSGEVV